MDINKYLSFYSFDYFKIFEGEKKDNNDESQRLEMAKMYLEKYGLDDMECYMSIFKKIFSLKTSDEENAFPNPIFNSHFIMSVSTGGCLFEEKDFDVILKIGKEHGDRYLYVIEDERYASDKDFVFRMKYPIDITWEEMVSGAFISDTMLYMPYKNYFVFGDSGLWGRYCDNEFHEMDILGYIKQSESIKMYIQNKQQDGLSQQSSWLQEVPNELKPFVV